jgi:FkbM family methyltransferase
VYSLTPEQKKDPPVMKTLIRPDGHTVRRLKKLRWKFSAPLWAENKGISLPTRHPLISPGIQKKIYFGEYEAKESDIVDKRLESDDVVMEVGAGIGYLSALCAKRIGSDRVHAYEANPAMMDVIAATYQRNGVKPRSVNAMMGRGSGVCTLHVEEEFWASSTIVGSARAKQIEVPQIDLNDEFDRIRPSFLIIDIEGGEIDFFKYATLNGLRKICVETHPGMISNEAINEMFAGLIAKGFLIDFTLLRKNVFYLYREPRPAQ